MSKLGQAAAEKDGGAAAHHTVAATQVVAAQDLVAGQEAIPVTALRNAIEDGLQAGQDREAIARTGEEAAAAEAVKEADKLKH